jgi:hypothetical protein
LLADAGLVLPPQFNWLVSRGIGNDGGDEISKVYGMARPSLPAV